MSINGAETLATVFLSGEIPNALGFVRHDANVFSAPVWKTVPSARFWNLHAKHGTTKYRFLLRQKKKKRNNEVSIPSTAKEKESIVLRTKKWERRLVASNQRMTTRRSTPAFSCRSE
jgi:hypothetical protein